MDFREQLVPGKALISGYGEGAFRVGDTLHKGHLLIWPEGFALWPIKSKKTITKQSVKPFFESGYKAEFLIVGLGSEVKDQVIESRRLTKLLGLPVEVMTTGAAARTYNVLTLEDRLVAAALWAD